MGNVPISCCRSKSPRLQQSSRRSSHCNDEYSSNYQSGKKSIRKSLANKYSHRLHHDEAENNNQSSSHILQHISEREPDDSETDPSSNPFNRPIFAARSRSSTKTSVNRISLSHQQNDLSYSSSNSTHQKQTVVTPLMSSQDCGYNSTTSTNLSQLDRQINDSFEISIRRDQRARVSQTRNQNDEYNPKYGHLSANTTTSGSDFANTSSGYSDNLLIHLNSPTESGGNITSNSNTSDGLHGLVRFQGLRKSSSCSTILTDGSTISQPDFNQTIKCVSLAIYYHIKNRTSDNSADVFDESIHPLKMPEQKENETGDDQQAIEDNHDDVDRLIILDQDEDSNDELEKTDLRTIYSFVKTLFKAAQLTSEYAITTLVYLERLMTYAEMDLTPRTWRRMFLGAILLSSKVWEDQAVWNVDYAQILEEISVDDINELESQFLELIQFNMNVPSSVYAKYYFHLRTLSLKNGLSNEYKLLTVGEARTIEAMSRVQTNDWQSSPIHRKTSPDIKRHTSLEKLRLNGFAKAVLM